MTDRGRARQAPYTSNMADRPRVLLVEDDARLVRMLDQLLSNEGYDTVIARDGQRALHEGLTQAFDVIVLDRGLPVMEGLDVLTRLRGRGVLTPALVLSALGNPADRVEGLDRGAEDYLAKPFDIDELLARIRALLRRHSSTVRSSGSREAPWTSAAARSPRPSAPS